MTAIAHAADHRSQSITLPNATAHRETWELEVLEFVSEFETERDEDLALALGRSLYAIRSIRAHLADRLAHVAQRRTLSRRELVVTSYDEWERSFDA